MATLPALSADVTGAYALKGDASNQHRIRLSSGEVFVARDLATVQRWIVEHRLLREDEMAAPGSTFLKLGDLSDLSAFFEVVDAADQAIAAKSAPAVKPEDSTQAVSALEGRVEAKPTAVDPSVTAEFFAKGEGEDEGDPELAIRKGHFGRNASVAVVLLALAGFFFYAFFPEPLEGLFALGKPTAPLPVPKPSPVAVVAPPALVPNPAPPAPTPSPPQPPPESKEVKEVKEAAPNRGVAAAPEVKANPALAVLPSDRSKGPKSIVARAEKLREKGDLKKALVLFDRTVELYPDNVSALTGRGLCYLDLESYEEAVNSFKEALRVDPKNADALIGEAEAFRSLGRAKEAIRDYEKYLAVHPEGEDVPVARNALDELRR